MVEKQSKEINRGGKRAGAGRPRGSPNKANAERQAAIAASGMTPLEYLLSVMRDGTADIGERLDAAKAAAPYVHPKLSALEISGNDQKPLAIRWQS